MARGRPRLFDTDAILVAAREVFVERGVNATTEDVAARAGVSEALLYHRFSNKEGLFRAAMSVPAGARPACIEALATENYDDVGRVLERTALHLIEWATMEMPIVMMSWSNRESSSIQKHLQAAKDPPLYQHKAVRGYLERMRAAGALTETSDPDAMAFAFLGGIRGYVFLRIIYGPRDPNMGRTATDFAAAMARLLVPTPAESPRGRSAVPVAKRTARR
ncbi:TetR/AcrR family transcriptional regulator [soil metagenome]